MYERGLWGSSVRFRANTWLGVSSLTGIGVAALYDVAKGVISTTACTCIGTHLLQTQSKENSETFLSAKLASSRETRWKTMAGRILEPHRAVENPL